MAKAMQIEYLRQVIDASNLAFEWSEGYGCWWRGHADREWRLQPSIYRSEYSAFREGNLARRFRQAARPRNPNCPRDDDLVAWLFLMQHYGLPTRLLDWTISPLVATFFACMELPEVDASLVATCPAGLNEIQIGVCPCNLGIASPHSHICNPDREIDFSAQDLFDAALRGVEGPFSGIIAILPDYHDTRAMVQQAAVTYHGSCEAMTTPVIEFVIPSSAKKDISQELELVGITESAVFPDLDHLSSVIRTWK